MHASTVRNIIDTYSVVHKPPRIMQLRNPQVQSHAHLASALEPNSADEDVYVGARRSTTLPPIPKQLASLTTPYSGRTLIIESAPRTRARTSPDSAFLSLCFHPPRSPPPQSKLTPHPRPQPPFSSCSRHQARLRLRGRRACVPRAFSTKLRTHSTA